MWSYYQDFFDDRLMGELCEHLRKLGLDATLLDSPEVYRFFPVFPLPPLGCVKIERKNIDFVLVQIGAPAYLYYYVVREQIDGQGKNVKASFESKWHDRCSLRPGFRRIHNDLSGTEILDAHWRGKELAHSLNADRELTTTLYREGLDSLRILPDRDQHPVIGIIHPVGHHRRLYTRSRKDMIEGDTVIGYDIDGNAVNTIGKKQFVTREAFEAYDRIAHHIHRIVGTGKTCPQDGSR